ncbi:hypothetical protein VTN96DRAFT_1029 [Rasamsonia emersonii]
MDLEITHRHLPVIPIQQTRPLIETALRLRESPSNLKRKMGRKTSGSWHTTLSSRTNTSGNTWTLMRMRFSSLDAQGHESAGLSMAERQKHMSQVAEKNLKKAPIWGFTEKVTKSLLFAKDFISAAASANPHIGLAWAGVCVLLPLLLNPVEQPNSLKEGVEYIFDLTCRFTVVERVYQQQNDAASHASHDDARLNLIRNFEAKITQLLLSNS